MSEGTKSTRIALLAMIEDFLEKYPIISASAFGWDSCGDYALVKNLREGKDVTTGKMDAILNYIKTETTKLKETFNE